MTNSSAPRRRHLASSPFAPDPEPTIEEFSIDDPVCHDLYGLGKVVNAEAHAVTVDFGAQRIRIRSPYAKLQHL